VWTARKGLIALAAVFVLTVVFAGLLSSPGQPAVEKGGGSRGEGQQALLAAFAVADDETMSEPRVHVYCYGFVTAKGANLPSH